MRYKYKIVESEILYEGFLQLQRIQFTHELFAGGSSDLLTRERIEGFRAASVLLYDPRRDEVVMIEQFRIGAQSDPDGCWLLETVGGLIEDRQESPEAVAKRESQEEAGCQILDLVPITNFWVSPGFSTEHISLFCGKVDASQAGGIHGLAEEGEDIRVVVLKAEEVIAELYGGRVNSTSAIIAVQWLALHRENLQQRWC